MDKIKIKASTIYSHSCNDYLIITPCRESFREGIKECEK